MYYIFGHLYLISTIKIVPTVHQQKRTTRFSPCCGMALFAPHFDLFGHVELMPMQVKLTPNNSKQDMKPNMAFPKADYKMGSNIHAIYLSVRPLESASM